MADMVTLSSVSRWTGNETSRASYLRALEPNNATALKDLETIVLGLPHFEVTVTHATNTDTANTINLTSLGVTFPDGTQRTIVARAHIADNDGQGIVETKGFVDGGSTPIVVTDSASADPLVSGLAGTPTMVLSVSTTNVILTLVGISAVPTRWVVKIWVSDATPLAYIS